MPSFLRSLLALSALTAANASHAAIIVSGDSSFIYTDFINAQNPDNDNFTFLRNLLGDGDRVVISAGALPSPGSSILTSFYGSLPSTTAALIPGSITDASLESAELLIVALPSSPFSSTAIDAIQDFLDLGNNVLFIGENSTFSTQNTAINSILSSLGSELRINSEIEDSGTVIATTTNGQILAHPLTDGIDIFVYGGFGVSGVLGGKPLVLLRDGTTPLITTDAIPETSSLFAIAISTCALGALRLRQHKGRRARSDSNR